MPDHVYVLTNAAMPGIVKIGRSGNVPQRVRSLSSHSGVPVPFEIELAIKVTDAKRVEAALHGVLQGSRLNPKREFFEVDVEDLRTVLTECGKDVTDSLDARHAPPAPDDALDAQEEAVQQLGDDDFEASDRLRQRRPPLDFYDLGIESGSQLTCMRKGPSGKAEQATVVEPKRVEFREEQMSLTQATRLALGRSYDVPPLPYWRTADNRLLQDIYDDRHGPQK